MSRVYIVTDAQTNSKTLVEADTQHQAIGLVVSGRYSAAPASAKEVMDAMSEGTQVLKKVAPAPAIAAEQQPTSGSDDHPTQAA
jgi:hypothetical protein